jgi:hypothetical protein
MLDPLPVLPGSWIRNSEVPSAPPPRPVHSQSRVKSKGFTSSHRSGTLSVGWPGGGRKLTGGRR